MEGKQIFGRAWMLLLLSGVKGREFVRELDSEVVSSVESGLSISHHLMRRMLRCLRLRQKHLLAHWSSPASEVECIVNGPQRKASRPVMLRFVKFRVSSSRSELYDASRASRSWISGRWWLDSIVFTLDTV